MNQSVALHNTSDRIALLVCYPPVDYWQKWYCFLCITSQMPILTRANVTFCV